MPTVQREFNDLENQDPNNASVAEKDDVIEYGDNEGNENDLENEKKSFLIIRKVGNILFFILFN